MIQTLGIKFHMATNDKKTAFIVWNKAGSHNLLIGKMFTDERLINTPI